MKKDKSNIGWYVLLSFISTAFGVGIFYLLIFCNVTAKLSFVVSLFECALFNIALILMISKNNIVLFSKR